MSEPVTLRRLLIPSTGMTRSGLSAKPIDPSWNFVPRTALFYSLPLVLFALCLQRGIGASRNFWVPLLFCFLALLPATRRSLGRPLAHKDFQDRDGFLPTYALLPASVWFLAASSLDDPRLAAAVFLLVMAVHDALCLHYGLLCVYCLPGSRGLLGYSLPLWGWAALALLLVDRLGADSAISIAGSSLLVSLPVAAVWLYLRIGPAKPQRFTGIRKAVVIGAGWSGLYAVKELAQAGIEVTCLESTDGIGGIWRYRSDRPSGVAASTRTTSSKHFLHASDFPFPADSEDFLHHGDIVGYLESYVDAFGLRDRIRLNAAVEEVARSPDGWRVTAHQEGEGRVELDCDAVVVATGPHQEPSVDPDGDPFYRRFTGRVLHSASYKNADGVEPGSTVLVVGAGESSADIVAECVGRGAQVHWATRSGQWFADRNMGPYPADHITTQGTRVFAGLFGNLEYIIRRFVARAFVNTAWGRGGHGIAAWQPETPYLHQFLNKSRDGILEIYRGRVVPHTAPESIEGRRVGFADGAAIEPDVIILATGYRTSWPFLADRPQRLYRLVFDPDDPTLAFVGFARPIVGSIPSLSELQARWVAGVWGGRATLPDRRRRHAEIEVDARHHERLIRDSSDLGILVDQELYATDLAHRIGAHVHWLKLLLTWPRAFLLVLISPWVAFKYRLGDPDRKVRRSALAHIARELPPPQAPNFLLAVGIVVFVAILAAGLCLLLWLLPLPLAVATLAGGLLFMTIGMRLSENDRAASATLLGGVREIFPW